MLTSSRSHFICLPLLILLALLSALALLLLAAKPLIAQTSPLHSDPDWQASYWNNVDLSGASVLQRSESSLSHDWGWGSPDSGIHADRFSARWTRYIETTSGRYRFFATSDDGIRVFVDGDRIINSWYDRGVRTDTADVSLSSGHHLIEVEYYEQAGMAVAKVWWTALDSDGSGDWRGEYYNGRDLSGTPAMVRYDDHIDFNWGDGSPAADRVQADDFSVRWTRERRFDGGLYRFTLTVDDGARLWVNHHQLIDAWREQASTTYSAEIYLASDTIPLRLEYFEKSGGARVQLRWERVDESGDGRWRGEYYNNRRLSGSPALVRDDRRIDFDWGDDSPAPGTIRSDDFSVRWTRTLYFDEGRYRFRTETDDGVRLFIDNRLVIDEWYNMSRDRFSYSLHLDQGRHTVRMEYFEDYGDAYARLRWDGRDEDEEEDKWHVGNIITCAPPQPGHNTWIKIYCLDPSGEWLDMAPPGIGPICASGYLKIDGIPVNVAHYGEEGQPYRVELWIDGRIDRSVGNIQAGEAAFRVRPDADNYTPWQCTPS